MKTVNITIRDVKEEALRELKAKAAKENKKLGVAVTEAIEFWVHAGGLHKKKKSKFTDLNPVNFGPGSEKWSTQIDEVLYG